MTAPSHAVIEMNNLSAHPPIEDMGLLQPFIRSKDVVVFAQTTCPFCMQVLDLFASLNVEPQVYQLNEMPNGAEIKAGLIKLTGQKTVPSVWIRGEFIGGCTDTMALHKSGELTRKLNIQAAPTTFVESNTMEPVYNDGDSSSEEETTEPHHHHREKKSKKKVMVLPTQMKGDEPLAKMSFLQFPDQVNEDVTRLVSLQVVAVCILGIIFRENTIMHYFIVWLLVEFALRFIFGGNASVQGALAQLLVGWRSPPKLISGPPKQFAALCGIIFSALAVGLFFGLSSGTGGAIVLGLLCGAASLEAFFNYCVGCKIFGYLIQFGLLSKSVYGMSVYTQDDNNYLARDLAPKGLEPVSVSFPFTNRPPTRIDLKAKFKTDDWTYGDFNMIKHVSITHFASTMAVTGLACVYKYATMSLFPGIPKCVWVGMSIFALVWFAFFLGLYVIKTLRYFHKVKKEWLHPMKNNAFAAIPLTILLFAYLSETRTLSIVLFWTSAPLVLFLGVSAMARWIGRRHDSEHLCVSWMMPTVGNLVAAFIAPTIAPGYVEAGWLWFSFGAFMWVVLFTITFHHIIVSANADDRVRSLTAMWVAAPAVVCVSYSALIGGFDSFSRFSFFVALTFSFVGMYLVFPLHWLAQHKFDMDYWMFSFPLDALCLASLFYANNIVSAFTAGIAITTMVFCTGAVTIQLLLTASATIRRRIFRPEQKWGPLSFNRLAHYGIEGLLKRIDALLVDPQVKAGDPTSMRSLEDLFLRLEIIHEIHSRHEDKIVFPAINSFFPGFVKHSVHEHVEQTAAMAEMKNLLRLLVSGSLKNEEYDQTVPKVVQSFTALVADIRAHLAGEERTLMPIGRKHIAMVLQKRILNDVWNSTTADEWAVFLPLIITYIQEHPRRIRFVRTLLWAMPERAQQIGQMLYLTLDKYMFAQLTYANPEMIPRGLPHWSRFY